MMERQEGLIYEVYKHLTCKQYAESDRQLFLREMRDERERRRKRADGKTTAEEGDECLSGNQRLTPLLPSLLLMLSQDLMQLRHKLHVLHGIIMMLVSCGS